MTDHKEFDDIHEMIRYLENKYEIKVLSVRDYGSRAWNLDSETSDMDAGMVFSQEPMDYIELGGYTQNIDRKFMLDGEEFELIGWNIKRFAELLNKSNPSMIEWLNSGITYYELEPYWVWKGEKIFEQPSEEKMKDPKLMRVNDMPNVKGNLELIRQHANDEFKPIALWGHYREMGKANYNKYIDNRNDLSIKRHLYILRGLTYAKYVLETHQRPPLDFQRFVDEELDQLNVPDMVKTYLDEFIRAKTNGEGSREIADQELWDWMSNEIEKGEEINHSEHDVRGISREKVNDLIRSVVPR